MEKKYEKPVLKSSSLDATMGRCCKEYRGDTSY